MSAVLDGRLYVWRRQMREEGWAQVHTCAPACTSEHSRAIADALLCENPSLNAVALRWDGR